MRSHDVIILFILPEWTKMSLLMQLTAVSFKKYSDNLNYAGYSSCLRKHTLIGKK